jgi:hypothetical protein
VEYRRLIGVPEHSVNSPLKHPELGTWKIILAFPCV